MATTVTIQPYGVYYKFESGKWENAQRLWDGNESSAPTNQSGAIMLKLDLSFLPTGAWITQVTARYVCKRGSNDITSVRLLCTNLEKYSLVDLPTVIKAINLEKGTYNVAEPHAGTVTMEPAESSAWLSKTYQLVSVSADVLNKGYELYLDIKYEEASTNLFVGANQAKDVYVGTAKASAVYLGDKKIL